MVERPANIDSSRLVEQQQSGTEDLRRDTSEEELPCPSVGFHPRPPQTPLTLHILFLGPEKSLQMFTSKIPQVLNENFIPNIKRSEV